jgi:rare lipoprotein A
MRMRRAIGLSLAFLVLSGTAIAKQAALADDREQQPRSTKAKPAKAERAAPKHVTARDRNRDKTAAAARNRRAAPAPDRERDPKGPDRYVGPVRDIHAIQVVGHREYGTAAWYGGRHLGRRTASGDVLDGNRPTAAHRSLPLNSLARVTNLNNGRAVIVQITDRGPAGAGRLIDVSPRAADELDMKLSGIAPVTVEPVVAAAHASAN